MFVSATLSDALDRIAERASDVRRAFEPGAVPTRDDVAAEGSPSPTLDPLSIALPDAAYLILDGADGARYTRDGLLRLENGRLVDVAGRPVRGTTGSPVGVDPVDAALGRIINPRLEPNGTLAYDVGAIDPRNGVRVEHRVARDRIALARFPAGSRPMQARDGGLIAPPGISPHVGAPGDGTFATVMPYRNTGVGIDIDASLARLEDAYVAFDAVQAAETAKGHLGKAAMDLLK